MFVDLFLTPGKVQVIMLFPHIPLLFSFQKSIYFTETVRKCNQPNEISIDSRIHHYPLQN